jgi:hypothetical protein
MVRPDLINSLTPVSYSVEAKEICCTIGKFTVPITTSGTSKTFSRVCLVVLSRTLLDGEKIKIGGTVLNILKKLNGDRLMVPFLSTVEARAMGRGDTAVCMIVWSCTGDNSEGITVFIVFSLTLKLI